jgi:hypothetical protein
MLRLRPEWERGSGCAQWPSAAASCNTRPIRMAGSGFFRGHPPHVESSGLRRECAADEEEVTDRRGVRKARLERNAMGQVPSERDV